MTENKQGNNVINNYKGVMLCSRPNQNNHAPVQRPFCGRVYNHDQVGLVPIKNERPFDQSPSKKPVPAILNRHKQWLEEFKQKQAKAKEAMDQKNKQEEQRFRKIKEIAENDRERAKKMKNQYNQTATHVLSVLDSSPTPSNSRPGELNADNLRRLDAENQRKSQASKIDLEEHTKKLFQKKPKQKPMWAISKEEREQKEEQQVDDLLDFFENNEVEKFSADEQVKNILQSLKNKINQIKNTQNWKEKEAERLERLKQERRKRRQKNQDDDNSDKQTNFSGNSQARSLASEKTQKKIEQLRKKKAQGDQDWDKYTASNKQSFANIEQKIAKNLADEVLRNYPNLKGVHSNTSIRKLIEAEAAKAIFEPIPRPVITTVVKQPKPLDTNNLPYLHRNPAI